MGTYSSKSSDINVNVSAAIQIPQCNYNVGYFQFIQTFLSILIIIIMAIRKSAEGFPPGMLLAGR